MSYPPSGSNVPPPPGGPFGQQPGPYGQQGPGQGQPGPEYPGQQGYPAPGGPPKKGVDKGLIAAIAGLIGLVVLVCCAGGVFFLVNSDEDGPTDSPTTSEPTESTTDPTTETTESTTDPTTETTEPTTEPTSDPTTSGSADGELQFPDSFNGWSKMGSSTTSLASYRKGSDILTALSTEGDLMSGYESAWADVTKVGDISCGTISSSSRYQCAGTKDGSTILVSSSFSTAKETAAELKALREAI